MKGTFQIYESYKVIIKKTDLKQIVRHYSATINKTSYENSNPKKTIETRPLRPLSYGVKLNLYR